MIELLCVKFCDVTANVQAKESADKQMHSLRSQLDSARFTMQQMQRGWDLHEKDELKAIAARSAAVEVRFSSLHSVLLTWWAKSVHAEEPC